jgi:plasmid stabilization system protein ParE
MRVRVTSAAEADLVAAVGWYHAQAPGIGLRFLAEYEAILSRLGDNPQQFPVIRGETRRAGFRHFPYGLFFRVRAAEVEIFACFHASRAPRHWQRRE